MKAVKNGKKKRSLLRFLLIGIVMSYFAFTFVQQQITMAKLADDATVTDQKIAEQQELQEKLDRQMNDGNELDQIERAARDKLGFLKKNERVFVDSSSR